MTTPNDLDPATGLSAADRRRAAIAVCAAADDVDQARDLLAALGLLDDLRQDVAQAS